MLTKLKDIRLKNNFTQEYIAFELGITQKAYSKLENGKTCISLNRILQLAKIFKIEPSSLCENGCDCSKYIKDFKKNTIEYFKSNGLDIPDFLF